MWEKLTCAKAYVLPAQPGRNDLCCGKGQRWEKFKNLSAKSPNVLSSETPWLEPYSLELKWSHEDIRNLYSSFNFLAENLEKFRSTELYGEALEGSTISLCRSYLGCTSRESCQLADLKYAIFSRTGCKTKKLSRLKLFLSMVFKHGFPEGSTSEQMWSTVFPSG